MLDKEIIVETAWTFLPTTPSECAFVRGREYLMASSNPNALPAKQGGNVYHVYESRWYDLAAEWTRIAYLNLFIHSL